MRGETGDPSDFSRLRSRDFYKRDSAKKALSETMAVLITCPETALTLAVVFLLAFVVTRIVARCAGNADLAPRSEIPS